MNYDRLLQLGGIDRVVPPIPGYITKEELKEGIDDINSKIPAEASSENQLATKEDVATSSATFRGTYNLVSDLQLSVSATRAQIEAALPSVISTADNNDFCNVQIPVADDNPTKIDHTERYKFNGTAWAYEVDIADPSSIPTALSDLSDDATHRLVTDDDKAAWNEIRPFIISMLAGNDFVDLGLPSGVLWCKVNIGAINPEDNGLYFSWGNMDGHSETESYDFSQSNYEASAGSGLTSNIPISSSFDMARKNYGAPAELPKKYDFDELLYHCNSEWTTQNGVSGVRFTSKYNSNSIFFPASGYFSETTRNMLGSRGIYWSGTRNSDSTAYLLDFTSSSVNSTNNLKYIGITVRAIIRK